MSDKKKLEFFYDKKSLEDSLQRTNAVALNPLDKTQAYTIDGSTKVLVVLDGISSYGVLNYFYMDRDDTSEPIPSTVIASLLCDYGSLSFTLVLPDLFFVKDKEYETYCSYRDGIFSSSVYPRVTAVALDNPEETRAYAVYF
jgi:hypothetical protein